MIARLWMDNRRMDSWMDAWIDNGWMDVFTDHHVPHGVPRSNTTPGPNSSHLRRAVHGGWLSNPHSPGSQSRSRICGPSPLTSPNLSPPYVPAVCSPVLVSVIMRQNVLGWPVLVTRWALAPGHQNCGSGPAVGGQRRCCRLTVPQIVAHRGLWAAPVLIWEVEPLLIGGPLNINHRWCFRWTGLRQHMLQLSASLQRLVFI